MKKTCTRCLNFTTIYLTRLGEILGFVSSLLLLFSTTINFSALVVPIFGMHCSGKSLNVHISHGGSAWKVINWLQSRWICHGRIQLDNFSSLSASSFLNATHTKKIEERKEVINSSYGNADQVTGARCCVRRRDVVKMLWVDCERLQNSTQVAVEHAIWRWERDALNFQLWRSKAPTTTTPTIQSSNSVFCCLIKAARNVIFIGELTLWSAVVSARLYLCHFLLFFIFASALGRDRHQRQLEKSAWSWVEKSWSKSQTLKHSIHHITSTLGLWLSRNREKEISRCEKLMIMRDDVVWMCMVDVCRKWNINRR